MTDTPLSDFHVGQMCGMKALNLITPLLGQAQFTDEQLAIAVSLTPAPPNLHEPKLLEACLSGYDDGMDGDILSLAADRLCGIARNDPGAPDAIHLIELADALEAKQALQHDAIEAARGGKP